MAECQCVEGRFVGRDGRVTLGPAVHDCEYVRARNALIPEAEAAADDRHPEGGEAWTAVFCSSMEHLVRAAGLVSRQGD